MKKLNMRPAVGLLMLAVIIFFTACNTDSETIIIPKALEQYKSEYKTFITDQKNVVNTVVIGYNKGNFKTTTSVSPLFDSYKAAYLTDLNAAQTVVDKSTVTIADIIKSQGNLTANSKLFNDALWISDRRALNDLVVELTTLNTNTLVGTTAGTTTQAAKDALTAAITAGKSVRDSGTSIQRVVDSAVATLSAAKTTFQAAIIK